jgi:hypothetical protein
LSVSSQYNARLILFQRRANWLIASEAQSAGDHDHGSSHRSGALNLDFSHGCFARQSEYFRVGRAISVLARQVPEFGFDTHWHWYGKTMPVSILTGAFFPASDFGPLLFCALRRLAAIWLSLAMIS